MQRLAFPLLAACVFAGACDSSEPTTSTPSVPPPTINTGPAPGLSAGCGQPTPPLVSRVKLVAQGDSPSVTFVTADALVGPDPEYCAKVGFADGRSYCPVRLAGAADQAGCEAYVLQRQLLVWTRNGSACTGLDSGCEIVAGEPLRVRAYGAGTYRACVGAVCGEIAVE